MSKNAPEAGEVWINETNTLQVVIYSHHSSVVVNEEEWPVDEFLQAHQLYRKANGVKVT